MIIKNINLTQREDRVKLSADIVFKGKKPKEVFFSFPEKFKDYVAADASPFLAALALPAMQAGQSIYVSAAVSKKLLANIGEIYKIWNTWDKSRKPVNVSAGYLEPDKFAAEKSAAFFTCGVDSFHTVLENQANGNKISGNKIDYLIFVHGFDIALNDKKLYGQIRPNIVYAASQLGIELIEVQTNIRELTEKYMPWDYAHGGAAAGVALALRKALRKAYLSGTVDVLPVKPYGSRPDLDYLWATETFEVIHYGGFQDRWEKIKDYLSKFDPALETLRVCWRNTKGSYNCGECEKCLRTMLCLEAAGVLPQCHTFNINHARLMPDALRKLYIHPLKMPFWLKMREVFERTNQENSGTGNTNGYSRLIGAIDYCIKKNTRRSFISRLYYSLREKAGKIDARYLNGKVFRVLSRAGVL